MIEEEGAVGPIQFAITEDVLSRLLHGAMRAVMEEFGRGPRESGEPVSRRDNVFLDMVADMGVSSLPSWSGEGVDCEAAEEFIEKLEELKKISGWKDDMIIRVANMKMTGSARQHRKLHPEKFSETLDFSAYKKNFLSLYLRKKPRTALVADLLNIRKRESESWQGFGDRCDVIGKKIIAGEYENKASARALMDELVFGAFCREVPEATLEHLESRNVKTLQDAIREVVAVESRHEERKRTTRVKRIEVTEPIHGEGKISQPPNDLSGEEDGKSERDAWVTVVKRRSFNQPRERGVNKASFGSQGNVSNLGRSRGEGRLPHWNEGPRLIQSNSLPKSPCPKCRGFGHWARDCPNFYRADYPGVQRGARANNRCNGCGQEGHFYATCPQTQCNLCSRMGHIRRDCPYSRGRQQRHFEVASNEVQAGRKEETLN